MVLDDTPEGRAMIAAALDAAGFDVLDAATGEQALELAHSRAPDLLIADPLRAGMDSQDFALALSVDPGISKTSVVFCGEGGDARELRCLAESCGVSHVLIKPCDPGAIVRFLGEIAALHRDLGGISPTQPLEREQL